jgi:hypothetical protein
MPVKSMFRENAKNRENGQKLSTVCLWLTQDGLSADEVCFALCNIERPSGERQ